MKRKLTVKVGPRAAQAMMRLGEHIRTARLARKMTQAELAERAGMGLATYKRLEKGDPSVSSAHVLGCLDVLGLLQQAVDAIGPSTDREGEARRVLAVKRARRSRAEDDYDF